MIYRNNYTIYIFLLLFYACVSKQLFCSYKYNNDVFDNDEYYLGLNHYDEVIEEHRTPMLKQKRESFEEQVNNLLIELRKIQDIREFDPQVLMKPTDQNINSIQIDKFNKIPHNHLLLGFYSEDKNIRYQTYVRKVKQPLISILNSAVHIFHSLPKSFEHLSSYSLKNHSLLDLAIEDIFSQEDKGLKGLQKALEEIRDKETLSSENERKLSLFTKVAGYYYDNQMIGRLTTYLNHSTSLLKGQDSSKERLAILRIIHTVGEQLKPVLPSTLKRYTNFPNSKVLLRLRSRLAHLNPKNLNKLLQDPTTEFFELLENDLKSLSKILSQESLTQFSDDKINDLSTYESNVSDEAKLLELWNNLKNEDEYSSKENLEEWINNEPENWKGFKQLYRFFEPFVERKSNKNISLKNTLSNPYIKEIEHFLPQKNTSDRKEFEDKKLNKQKELEDKRVYLKKLIQCMQYFEKLDRKEKLTLIEEKKFSDLCKTLKINCENTDSIKDTKKLINNIQNDKYVCALYEAWEKVELAKDRKIKKELTKEAVKLKEKFLLEILKVSDEQSDNWKKEESCEQARLQLQEKLHSIKPSKGHNFQEKLQELINIINDARRNAVLEPINFTYDWSLEPKDDVLEQLFYKIHRIKFLNLKNKNQHRVEYLTKLLDIIEIIRRESKIETDIKLEQRKLSFNKTLFEKQNYLIEALESIKFQSMDKTLQYLQQKNSSIKQLIEFQNILIDYNKALSVEKNSLIASSEEQVIEFYKDHFEKDIEELDNFLKHNKIAVNYLNSNGSLVATICTYLNRIRARTDNDPMNNIVKTLLINLRKNNDIVQQILIRQANILAKEELNKIEEINQLENIVNQFKLISNDLKSFTDIKFDEQKQKIEELKGEAVSLYKSLSDHPLIHITDWSLLKNNLSQQILASKRELLEESMTYQRILSNPLNDHFNLFRYIKENFEGNNNFLNIAAHEFLVGFFYDNFKEINDYPELDKLKHTTQLRNHYQHKGLEDDKICIVPGRLQLLSSANSDLAQEVAIISINIKFVLETLIDKLKKDIT